MAADLGKRCLRGNAQCIPRLKNSSHNLPFRITRSDLQPVGTQPRSLSS
jgi:hypothetical protein